MLNRACGEDVTPLPMKTKVNGLNPARTCFFCKRKSVCASKKFCRTCWSAFCVVSEVGTTMLETTNPRSSVAAGTCCFCRKQKIFEYTVLSCLLLCRFRSHRKLRFQISGFMFFENFLMMQVILLQDSLIRFCNLYTFLAKNDVFEFFSNFDLTLHLMVIIVIHFCFAKDAKLCFACV